MTRVRLDGERRLKRPALLGSAVLIALAIVALASRGHAPTAGAGRSRNVNGELLFEYLVLITLGLAFVVVPFVAHSFWVARRHSTLPLPQRRNWMIRVFAALVLGALIVGGIAAVRLIWGDHSSSGLFGGRGGGVTGPASGSEGNGRPVRFDWVPAVVIGSLVLAVALVVAGVLRRDRKARRRSPEAIAAQLSNVLDDTLDDLRAERDPRRAVIAAYARMERALAWFGLPRSVYEAPLEYLARILAELHASQESIRRLTELFERAKFSAHSIGPRLKDDAIEALVAVRDELRSYR
jgi:uncharacterized protein DUF4129